MYSRVRGEGETKILIPENYDGTAFMESTDEPTRVQSERNIRVLGECSEGAKMSPQSTVADEECACDAGADESVSTGSFFEKLPFGNHLSKWLGGFSGVGILPKRLGTEEILIIATALFLFFSKSGDKECAIMLALLLLVAN